MNDPRVMLEAERQEENHLCRYDSTCKKKSKLALQEEYINNLRDE
jgi:hypothetical protein